MNRSALMIVAVLALGAGGLTAPARSAPKPKGPELDHIVVIYEENHSFDNLFGGWERVNGLHDATARPQVAPDGTVLPCLPQNDVNLTSPPLPVTCRGTVGSVPISSAFANSPFRIDDYIQPDDTTCPIPGAPFLPNGVPNGAGRPGGCTCDLVHRFYNEQYQIDGGRQDRYVAGSDAVGLTMGTYDTSALPIYRYLHSSGAPHYAIADNFFQAAFGGSFLNHQWLIAARTPTWPGAVADGGADDLHSIVGADGFPAVTPLHPATPGTKDAALTQAANADGSCKTPVAGPTPPPGTVCGDYAVNTVQPFYQPFAPGTTVARRLPPQTAPTIGDRLSDAGVDWAWYSGGWSNADGDVDGPGWTNGATPGTCTTRTPSRARYIRTALTSCSSSTTSRSTTTPTTHPAPPLALRTCETSRSSSPRRTSGDLKPVSFVKPIGAENEHPGYASEALRKQPSGRPAPRDRERARRRQHAR